ncbi:tWiK family of potassium channels protein 7 [Elysia marginata]|uniref:TWiK family of potassium channels protein 7 n=1 Tax=Elysia marginata TaxID=1093978 RepID=A0AAV4F0Y6_9GAST|nr:tWiK family of potassium channels protein 7 [Elysia marginata]
MEAGLMEVATPPSSPSSPADSVESKRRKKKKTGSKEKTPPGKDKKGKKDKSSSKGSTNTDDDIFMVPSQKHSSPEGRDEVALVSRVSGKGNQDIEVLMSDNIRGFDKASTLPPSPTSPTDSVFEESPFPLKREHSKSRSRSGSRSRFSGLFKRKKQRSHSETDVTRDGDNNALINDEQLVSRDRSRRAKSATSNRTNNTDADHVGVPKASGTFPRKANLKKESPYHAYDSRMQPRDRLMNMTVRDAAKEHRLRRVDSGGLSNRKSRQEDLVLEQGSINYDRYMVDASYPFHPEHFSTSSLSSRGPMDGVNTGADYHQTSALVHNTTTSTPESSARSSTLPRVLRSKSSSYAPFGYSNSGVGDGMESSNVSLNLPRNASTPAFARSAIGFSENQPNVSQEPKVLAQNQNNELTRDGLGSAQSMKPNKDGSRADIGVNPQNMRSEEPDSEAGIKEKKRNKRKASLSKFLELRQAVPSGLALTRRTSQSSDSGVTSRDTSPGTSVIRRNTRQERGSGTSDTQVEKVVPSNVSTSELPTSPPSSFNPNRRRSTNPYVVSSVEIPDLNMFAAPRLYLNGTNLEQSSDAKHLQTQNAQEASQQGDTGKRDSSFICPSPNMETSQSSSYRSSDQGFVESEVSDADVEDTADDDNSDFSTPPEMVEPFSTSKEHLDPSMRFATPKVLEKLLENTQKEISQGRNLLPNYNLDNPALLSDDRYVPYGIRRSNSERENTNRPTSPRRTFRQGPSLSDSATETTALSESLETLKELPSSTNTDTNNFLYPADLYPKEYSSAGSTCTLTNLESVGSSSNEPLHDPHPIQDRADVTGVPRLGINAQQKYRRTFSPVRVKKALVATPEEDFTGPPNTSNNSVSVPTYPPPPSSDPASIQTQPETRPISIIPALSPTPRPVSSSQQHVSATTTLAVPEHQKSCGDNRAIERDAMRDKKFDSSESPSNPEQINKSDRSPFAGRLMSTGLPQDSMKASSLLLGRGTSFLTSKDIYSDNSRSTMPSINQPVLDEIVKNVSSQQQNIPTTETEQWHGFSAADETVPGSSQPSFPMIHGLELAVTDKEPKFKGKSLSGFLQQQARAKWQLFGSPKKDKSEFPQRKEKSQSPTKREKSQSPTKRRKSQSPTKKEKSQSPAYKTARNEAKQEQIKEGEKPFVCKEDLPAEDIGEISPARERRVPNISAKVSPEKSNLSSTRRDGQEPGMLTMIDKECQTSAWLINSLIKPKAKKAKKKAYSFTKTKSTRRRRRNSSCSDTYIPVNLSMQRRGATQWSSLGDVRVVAAYEDRHRSVSPEKKLKRSKSAVSSKRSINNDSVTESSNQARNRAHSDDSDPPKPKKLSLTAIILLKNRLAKFKERKNKERETHEAEPEDDEAQSDVPSDTMMTIENEINLSKLEVSKETDIVDDDIFEPEFSLDYSKRQIRFEDLPPPSEPMQSEEPLPPLPPQTSRRMRQRRESTMRERRRKCVSYCKKFIAFLFSHIGLCSLVVAYTIMGGFIFQWIENDKDMDSRRTVTVRRSDMVGRLIALAVDFKATEGSMQNLTAEVEQSVQEYQTFIYEKVKNEAWDGQDEGVWSFASSMLYAITVTTTIGEYVALRRKGADDEEEMEISLGEEEKEEEV